MKKNKNNKKHRIRNNIQSKRQRSGQIYKNHVKPRLVEGKFSSTNNGGIVFLTNGDEIIVDKKYFVDPEYTMGAMNGDTVLARVKESDRSAKVAEVMNRVTTKLIGTVYINDAYIPPVYFEPEDRKIKFSFLISENKSGKSFKDGDKCEIEIVDYPESAYDEPSAILTEVFGSSESREANYMAVLHECDIATEFDDAVLKEAENVANTEVVPDGRTDLRNLNVFTIDGADAKDLDDAISVERSGEDYILGVHIADVSHYVTEDSCLDREAFERGTSVYFTDKVVPMLPKAISNGICSLNAGQDRYALSVFAKINKYGEIIDTKIEKTILKSRVKGVYSEINDIIAGKATKEVKEKYSVIGTGTLNLMVEIYKKLKNKNDKRGAINLDSEECKIILDEKGNPTDIVARETGESEQAIEQFMLCANEAVATFLTDKGCPCVYRIHEVPEREKIRTFLQFANNLNLNPGYVKKDSITPGYFSKILEKARANGISGPVSYVMLRTMQKAKYSEKNLGHFGLASPVYCHFTAPIRRYPDLAVHRILSYFISRNDAEKVENKYSDFAVEAAKKSTENELKALRAERDIEDLYKCIYMKNHIGKVFDAVVSSVTSFGLFCTLENTCEGLVPMNLMKYKYLYDESTFTLRCANNSYKLGDKVKIRVENSDIPTRKLTFVLEDEPDIRQFHTRYRRR